MNQKQLAEKLAKKFGEKKVRMEAMIETLIETISEALQKGDKVRLVGFGNFTVRNRKGRVGRNPRTGEKMDISSTKCPAFVPGFNLKKIVKGK